MSSRGRHLPTSLSAPPPPLVLPPSLPSLPFSPPPPPPPPPPPSPPSPPPSPPLLPPPLSPSPPPSLSPPLACHTSHPAPLLPAPPISLPPLPHSPFHLSVHAAGPLISLPVPTLPPCPLLPLPLAPILHPPSSSPPQDPLSYSPSVIPALHLHPHTSLLSFADAQTSNTRSMPAARSRCAVLDAPLLCPPPHPPPIPPKHIRRATALQSCSMRPPSPLSICDLAFARHTIGTRTSHQTISLPSDPPKICRRPRLADCGSLPTSPALLPLLRPTSHRPPTPLSPSLSTTVSSPPLRATPANPA